MAENNGQTPNARGDRQWEVHYDEAFDGPNPDELELLLTELGSVVRRTGGVVTFAALRREIQPGVFVTEKIVAKWSSFTTTVYLEGEEQGADDGLQDAIDASEAAAEPEPEPAGA